MEFNPSWWPCNLEALSVLSDLCGVKTPLTGGFPAQMTSSTKFGPQQSVKQTVVPLVIWGAMTFIWRHRERTRAISAEACPWWRHQRKHFPRYWPFVRGIHRSPVNSPHKGQWRGALMFFFYLCPKKRLSKQSWGWWFETPSGPLWRHSDAIHCLKYHSKFDFSVYAHIIFSCIIL